jgi:tetratricopeptide (TPR) repeat protein
VRRRPIGVALLCLVVAGCAAAPAIPHARLTGWHSIRHPSFRLVGDLPADELRRLADELALFDRVFARLARIPAEPLEPIAIYLLSDPQLTRPFGLAGSVAGWMLATLEGCFAAVEAGRTHIETRATLLHEYTHALLRRNRRGPLPPWYDEGLSTYFSTFSIRNGGAVVGGVPSAEIGWIASRGPIPLARLFEGSTWKIPQPEVQDFYATAWALSHHLLTTPRGRQELTTFAAHLERGEPWQAAQAAAFGRPVERLQSELELHVKLLSRGVAAEAVIDSGDQVPLAPLEISPVSMAEIAYELGFLALQVGDQHPGGSQALLARALFEVALDEHPSAARAEAALAEALALAGDARQALPRGERAVARAPQDVRVRLQAGRVALAHADAGGDRAPEVELALLTAEEHYRRALELDPASALAWAGLGQTCRRQARGDAAVAAFERARGLVWSPQIDLELGALYIASGRRDEAVALLWPLAGDPHGGRTREEARAQLASAGLHPDEATAAP